MRTRTDIAGLPYVRLADAVEAEAGGLLQLAAIDEEITRSISLKPTSAMSLALARREAATRRIDDLDRVRREQLAKIDPRRPRPLARISEVLAIAPESARARLRAAQEKLRDAVHVAAMARVAAGQAIESALRNNAAAIRFAFASRTDGAYARLSAHV